MKKYLACIALLLSVCILFASCAQGNPDGTGEQTTATTNTPTVETPMVKECTLNGHSLSEFAIVYSDEALDYNQRAAEYLKNEILTRTGYDLTVAEEDASHTSTYELVVGETSRSISQQLDAQTSGTKFAILATENAIAMEGEAFVIAAAAYFFVETYIVGDTFATTVPMEVSIHDPIVKEAKNYILLIGDGMGVNQTLLFDMLGNTAEYSDGEKQFYGYLLNYQGFSRTDSLTGTTDSAAGGTALSSGYKTENGRVGQDGEGNSVQLLTELALSLGKSAGVMSTETYTGATPSTFYAHTDSRDDTSNLVLASAAFQKLGGQIDCGYDSYTANGVATIENKINQMLLSLGENAEGFFLMYEEAHIDKHCHKNEMEKTALALARFNQAIGVFMEYAFYHPDTVVLITADHETGDIRTTTDEKTFAYHSEDHSSQDVPVFAYGYGMQVFDGKTVENVQIAKTIAAMMGVTDFGNQSEYPYLKQ